jgi:hypothetical protein
MTGSTIVSTTALEAERAAYDKWVPNYFDNSEECAARAGWEAAIEYICSQASVDLHKQKAAEMFNIPIEQVTEEQRRAGKSANYHAMFHSALSTNA